MSINEIISVGVTAAATMFGATVTLWARDGKYNADDTQWLPGLWATAAAALAGGLLALQYFRTQKESWVRDLGFTAATAGLAAVMSALVTATMFPRGVVAGEGRTTMWRVSLVVALVTIFVSLVRRFRCTMCE